MNKKLKTMGLYCFCALLMAATGCIQDEAPNSEAAIDGCEGEYVQMATVNADDKIVTLYVAIMTDMQALELQFALPEGATIAPTNPLDTDQPDKNRYDFSVQNTREFTVTSEDKAWDTTYKIKVLTVEMPLYYDFEMLLSTSNAGYDIFMQEKREGENIQMLQWESGNAGYKLTAMAQSRTDYPTMQSADGYVGKCVKLTTRSTGSFGTMLNPPMPIAAGNLFIGSFDLGSALTDARKATHFGFPFYKIPKTFSGYYKYKAGNTLTDANSNPISGKDACDIYAVMYEVENNKDFLDGGNSLDATNIVMLARLSEAERQTESDEWKKFNLTFEPQNNKTIDADKLKRGKYKLAIVCSSSVQGAYFTGAIGSTLYVDELNLICE